MKKSLIATLAAVPLLSLSSMVYASEPVLLGAAEMDGVTAGTYVVVIDNRALIGQLNTSPVTLVQISTANASLLGSAGNNGAMVTSGNMAYVSQ